MHLKFGKGESQGDQFIQGSSPWEPTAETDRKEKVSKPQISRQIPLEMGTGGGGGGGKKGEMVTKGLLKIKLILRITQVKMKMILVQKLLLN